jgi:1,5-anhydro-D-fructose reductase (1,5-anhydro-D-mannitol-forming)
VIRVAILSFWHVHADDYAREAQNHPKTQVVAAWDEDAARGRAKASSLGATFYDDLDELLARTDVDGVVVTTPTRAHREVIVAAARAGKHIFTEKVLALTPAECRAILAAVDRAGVKLTVSLPRLADGYTLATREILADGRLGEITLVRVRLSHDGAVGRRWLPAQFFDPDEAGGGALIDLGCHPMYLTRLFLGGMPDRVSASYGHVTGRPVEDNAVALLHYPSGAIGVVEAGFVNPHSPFTIEVHGTEGSLLYGTPEARLLVRTTPQGRDDAWIEVPLPDRAPGPFDQWVAHIEAGTTATENIDLAVDLTTLMDAANRSARTGRAVQPRSAGG